MLNWLYNKITSGMGGPDVDLRVTEAPHAPTAPGKTLPDRHKTISERFTYHPPTEQQVKKYTSLRTRGKELAFLIDELCPDSDEKATALRRLDEVIMHANAAIARHS